MPNDPQTLEAYVPDPYRWRTLGVLSIVLFMSLIDVSIVNVALPSIQLGLGATDAQLQWILSGYALTFGVGLVTAGRAGDIFGRGPLFMVGVVLFTLSSAAAGLAHDAVLLNVARAFQGIGSGLISPQVIGMVQQYFRGAERARAFAIFGAAVGISVAVGPLLGGLLIHAGGVEHGWRLTFFVNVPVGIVALTLALLWFPRPLLNKNLPATTRERTQNRDLDPVAAVLLGLAVLSLLLPFVEAGAGPWIWLSIPVGVGLVFLWLWWEQRQKQLGRHPMVDLGIFRVPSFANGTLLISVYFVGITSVWVLLALYLQDGLGLTALQTGLMGLPSAIVSGFAALLAGRNVVKHGRKVVIIGIYSALFGLLASILVVWLRSQGLASEWWLLLSLSFLGIGQGSVISPNQTLTLADVPLEYAGSSGGIMQTGQRIGTSVGIAMITALAFATLAVSDWSVAFIAGFAGITVVVSFALVLAYADQRQRVRLLSQAPAD